MTEERVNANVIIFLLCIYWLSPGMKQMKDSEIFLLAEWFSWATG